jgi:restriction system protein
MRQGAWDFANDKPLELLDGAKPLALLAEHANIKAKIVPPDDWHDSIADFPESTRQQWASHCQ